MNVSAEKPDSTTGKSLDVAKWLVVVGLLGAAVIGNAWYAEQPLLYRALAGVALVLAAFAVAFTTIKGREFNIFRREAVIELRKVVWPTRQETGQTTLLVFVVVVIMALILWALDALLSLGVSQIIG